MKKRKLLAAVLFSLLLAFCLSMAVSAASYKNEIVTKANGKQYYYNKKGTLVKDKYGYKIGENYYKISKKGVLTKVTKAEGLAGIQLEKFSGKTRAKLLKQAYQWSANMKYQAVKKPSGKTSKYAQKYAIIGFENKKGDCNVQAATFYYMAKVLGFDAKFVRGYVPQLQNGKIVYGAHAWTTITMKGVKYVYDPNFGGYAKRNNIGKGLDQGYKFKYGAKNTYKYYNLKKKEIKK